MFGLGRRVVMGGTLMVGRDRKEGWDGMEWIARVDYGGEWVLKGRRG